MGTDVYKTLSSEIKNRIRLQDALASIYFLAVDQKNCSLVKIAQIAKDAHDAKGGESCGD